MRCATCGRENALGSVFCQGCGRRLAEAPAFVPTPLSVPQHGGAPPGGFPPSPAPFQQLQQPSHAAHVPAPAAAPPLEPAGAVSNTCPRCRAPNPDGMRFCKDCGARMDLAVSVPQQPAAQPAPGAPRPNIASPQPHAVQPQAAISHAPMQQAAMQPSFARGPSAANAPPNGVPSGATAAGHLASAPSLASTHRAQSCARCGQANDPNHEYCRYCGLRLQEGVPASLPPAVPGSAPADLALNGASLVSILRDGTDGPVFALRGDQTDLGRTEGDIVLGDDPYLSPRHARLTRRGEGYQLRDLDSVNGVYVRIREPVDVQHGDWILLGQQVLRFDVLDDSELPLGPASVRGVLCFGTPETPRVARLVQYTTEGIGRDTFHLFRDETILGREHGDIVFTDDPFLSRRHAALAIDRTARRYVLRDLGSSNGTAIRCRTERTLVNGDHFRVGRHLFRLDVPRASSGAMRGAR